MSMMCFVLLLMVMMRNELLSLGSRVCGFLNSWVNSLFMLSLSLLRFVIVLYIVFMCGLFF